VWLEPHGLLHLLCESKCERGLCRIDGDFRQRTLMCRVQPDTAIEGPKSFA
jgi:hypothetical protein